MDETKKGIEKEKISIFQLCKQNIIDGKYDAWSVDWEEGTPRLSTGDKLRVHRLRALGNSVVPQCIQYIGECILTYEELEHDDQNL
jgi:hypothetical protein